MTDGHPTAFAPRRVILHRATAVDYGRAERWQRETAHRLLRARGAEFDAESAGDAPGTAGPEHAGETLALLEHMPVFTFGTGAHGEHLLVSAADLEARGAAVVAADRGGDVTFHGPGQLVAYPILDLRARSVRPVDYVRRLEETVIETVASWGLSASRVRGRPGVWVGAEKVAAVGVRIERGISRHGIALNVSPDLSWFDAIVPCGIADARVTSLDRLVGGGPSVPEVARAFGRAFERQFGSLLLEPPAGEALAQTLAVPE